MKINDVYSKINEIAPFDTSLSFDNTGLLIGDMYEDVNKALICLDLSDDVIEEALSIGATLIITHHPVIFSPLKSVSANSLVAKAIRSSINVLSCHTNLDKSESFGVNIALAKSLGLENVKCVSQDDILFVGELENEMDIKDFCKLVKENLNSECVLCTHDSKKVKSISFCSGAGGGMLEIAKMNSDVFLTGEIKHHEFLMARELNFPAIMAGHYETEKPFARLLLKYLQDEIKNVEFIISDKESNPVKAY